MGEAAFDISGGERSDSFSQQRSGRDLDPQSGPDFDLVRRLLLPPGWLGPRPYRLPPPDEVADEEVDDFVAQLEAENKVMKAVLRSEREAAAELRAQVAALTTRQAEGEETQDDLRADRDRWASLVERLLFTSR